MKPQLILIYHRRRQYFFDSILDSVFSVYVQCISSPWHHAEKHIKHDSKALCDPSHFGNSVTSATKVINFLLLLHKQPPKTCEL